ncbi:MAG: hypothetical protein HYY24_25885 [Verrucomicrobia bacterium]|nr:hypothetical protein [Verrucomicrobiota bacterium]
MMVQLVSILVLMIAANTILAAAPRDAQWKRVEEAMNKGLPKTAIEELEPIIKAALADKAWAEATKAIARKIALEGTIQGNKPEEKITRLEAEIAKAPKDIVPALDTVLANWYWHYFQANRWRFMRRTATAQAPGKDFTTWDLPRLFAEIDKQFGKALAAERELKTIPIATFDELLEKGTLPDAYRPTLYDFVAHEALAFYTSGEQAAAKPEDAFEVSADSPIFDTAEKFIAWQPATTQTDSPALKAIRLYQELLRFHQSDADPSAFLDADVARLVWAKNVAFGESKNARFKEAMKSLADKGGDHDLGSMVLYHWAQVVHEEDDFVQARELALRGKNAHPNSPGGKLCANLVAQIEAKSASIQTERIWNAPWPNLSVHHRNVTNVFFRAIAWDWDEFLQKRHNRPERLSDAERKQVLAKAPALEWSHALPPTTDFKERVESLPAPQRLKPGFYFLVASHDPTFAEQSNQLSMTDIWVSDLALVVRPRAGQLEGFVLQAKSGEPIDGAKVEAWHLDNQGNRVAVPATSTDANGFFTFKREGQRGYLLKATHAGQQIATSEDTSWQRPQKIKPTTLTFFFTDRTIYRPGQTIQYKGLCVRIDQEKDNYETISGQQVTVVFSDTNEKEIARQEHRCNDYGSFSGSFTAPRDRLTGRMYIAVTQGPNGMAWVNIEEYKRPKFQVTLDAPKTAAKLNEKVELTGHAMGYTGAAVDSAKVKWRVVREVRWPYWWGWYHSWRMRHVSASQEIAHGIATTETDGTFKIEFAAKPDPRVSEKDEASFSFSISADVTDSAGETRPAQRGIHVGFTALTATLSAEDWQIEEAPVELRVRTTTLDGEPQVTEGTVKVHRLKQPDRVHRPYMREISDYRPGPTPEKPDLSDPEWWELGEVVEEKSFTTDAQGNAKLSVRLGVGVYRAMLETQDRFGKKITARARVRVLNPGDTKLAIKIPSLLAAPKWEIEPGEEFMALWGTGYDAGRAFIEVEHRHKMIQRYWTKPGDTQAQIKQAVREAMRGGFTLHVTQVRENRAYLESRPVEVPWSNKELALKWEHFTSKLQPGQKETWTAVVQSRKPKAESRDAERAVAEMVATLFDASLDAFAYHGWISRLDEFRRDASDARPQFANGARGFQTFHHGWRVPAESVELRYRAFPPDLTAQVWWRGGRFMMRAAQARGVVESMEMLAAPTAAGVPLAAAEANVAYFADAAEGRVATLGIRGGSPPTKGIDKAKAGGGATEVPDLSQVTARKNLNEAAFFFPQLVSDSNGIVRLTFTMPEALTEWRFLGFAHDRACRSGFLEGKAVTAKDLMVQPNPPRFLREGDTLEFTVKVSNQSDKRQAGKVRLTFNDGWSDKPADALLGNRAPEQTFDILAKESRSFSWRLAVPDGLSILTYKAAAATDTVSDGEEGFLPVLARRVLVTESLPLPIRGPATKKFDFKRLAASGKSSTLRHQSLTVQMVSQPAWYAVMALPYLMEFPHECTEQTFNRFYANALARHIAGADPKIRRVFDRWKATPALDSPLEKNQDLKSVVLEETPWVRQAQNESQARKNVGVLFDDNRLNYEAEQTLQKLAEAQLGDGAWPWFPGGRGNDYITLYIATGFGRLRHLGVDVKVEPAVRSLDRLDGWIDERYRDILKHAKKEDNHLTTTIALYLYGRSFFLKDKPIAPQHKEAVDYFLAQARKYWLQLGERQSQGHLALALKRFNAFNASNDSTPLDVMKSLKERSVTNEELGLFWRDTELSWWWYRAPIETQAVMIEAFDEVAGDAPAVEECRVWLLKQKQTQDWKTTKATADAVYALLLRGRDLLASDKLVEVTLGGLKVTPGKEPIANRRSQITNAPEPGTGFYERRFVGTEIKPSLAQITVKKTDSGVAWGSVHWQYLEDMTKLTPYTGTPLKLKKTLFTKRNTSRGPELVPVTGPLAVGDELVVRIELRVDRDVEYVHLKDQRGSGTEPVNVLSGYRYQDGLAYYETTRDTASHFFIDYLPEGTYVFEYSTRIQHRGEYQSGFAEIQCMYAPEFNSHSESLKLQVR